MEYTHTHAKETHTHWCRLMTTLHQLNECLFFSSDAAGHLLSLDIDLYFNGANTTENNKSITGWGHVSPRTFGVLLANPFIPVQGIHYSVRLINAKMSHMHIWAWKPFGGQDTDSMRVCVCVCVGLLREEGGSKWCRGRGRLFIFHSWHISLGGPRRCSKKNVHLPVTWAARCNCSPLSSKWKRRSAISQSAGLKTRPQAAHHFPLREMSLHSHSPARFTRSRSSSSWQGNSDCVCVCVCTQSGCTGPCWFIFA